jgi:hypothetical protein
MQQVPSAKRQCLGTAHGSGYQYKCEFNSVLRKLQTMLSYRHALRFKPRYQKYFGAEIYGVAFKHETHNSVRIANISIQPDLNSNSMMLRTYRLLLFMQLAGTGLGQAVCKKCDPSLDNATVVAFHQRCHAIEYIHIQEVCSQQIGDPVYESGSSIDDTELSDASYSDFSGSQSY